MRQPYTLIPPGQRRGNPFYLLRGRKPDGRQFEVTTRCTDAKDAQRTAALIYAQIVANSPAAGAVARTFRDAADAYIRWRNPGKADLGRIERLCERLGTKAIGEVSQDDLVMAAKQHDGAVTGATLNREYTRPFAAILHYARDAGLRDDIRIRAFPERAPVVRVAERQGVSLLISNAATEPQRLLLLWLWELGSRISDTIQVEWSSIDLQAATVRLRIGKRRGHEATLPLPETLVVALGNVPSRHGRVFPWSTRSGVYKWLRPLCAKTGVTFRPHDARRALATEQFDAGSDPRLVQELMGHGSLKSTMRYRHVAVSKMADAQRKRG